MNHILYPNYVYENEWWNIETAVHTVTTHLCKHYMYKHTKKYNRCDYKEENVTNDQMQLFWVQQLQWIFVLFYDKVVHLVHSGQA